MSQHLKITALLVSDATYDDHTFRVLYVQHCACSLQSVRSVGDVFQTCCIPEVLHRCFLSCVTTVKVQFMHLMYASVRRM